MRRLLVLVLLPLALSAQSVTEQEIAARFVRGTGPDLAWAAYLAARDGLSEYIPQIEALLTHEDPKVRGHALHALANLGATTTPMEKVTPFLPQEFNSVMLLIGRQPEARELLLALSQREANDYRWAVLHSLLADSRKRGQAAILLREWIYRAEIVVFNRVRPSSPDPGLVCGDAFPLNAQVYPPTLPAEILIVNAPPPAGAIVRRGPYPLLPEFRLGYCSTPFSVDWSTFTLNFLRYLGNTIPAPKLEVAYTTRPAFSREVLRVQREWREFLAVLKASLIHTGAITESEWVEPRVEWTIRDLRKDRSVPLPPLP